MDIAIYGAGQGGNTLKECAELLGHKVLYFIDDSPNAQNSIKYSQHRDHIPVACEIFDPFIRLEILRRNKITPFTLIHPTAYVAPSAVVAPGCFIKAGAIVDTKTKLGVGVIVDNNASVAHDCNIEAGVHIAPGATIGSNVEIKTRSLIGINSTVVSGTTIGKDCIILSGISANGVIENSVVVRSSYFNDIKIHKTSLAENSNNNIISMHCPSCKKMVPFIICELKKDTRSPENEIWGDILCSECNYVLTTISSNLGGMYEIRRKS